jgi:hypothetical protein
MCSEGRFEFDKVSGSAIQCGHFDQSVCFLHKVVFVEIVQLQLFKITCHCRISRVVENACSIHLWIYYIPHLHMTMCHIKGEGTIMPPLRILEFNLGLCGNTRHRALKCNVSFLMAESLFDEHHCLSSPRNSSTDLIQLHLRI